MNIYTIGIYGWNAESFIASLRNANVSSLIDIRRRRGVRGGGYRFGNYKALEALLMGNGIRYLAESRLAPTTEMRELQKQDDRLRDIAKRDRVRLSPEFECAYRSSLELFSKKDWEKLLAEAAPSPAFLCVERLPEACHRSILATLLSRHIDGKIVHLIP